MNTCVNHPDRQVRAKGLCPSCYNREEVKRNPRKRRHIPSSARRVKLRHRYGIKPSDYDRMLSDQDGKCCVCKEIKSYDLYVDHDHNTGKVRSLLCARCNTMAGILEDRRLEDMLRYLTKHGSSALARLELLIKELENGTN